MSTSKPELTVADRLAIEDLLNEFAWRVDHGRAATVSELFTEDGAITTPMFSVKGRAEIEAHFARRDADGSKVSRHQWSNLRITTLGSDRARVEVIVQTHLGTRSGTGPVQPDHVVVGDSIDIVQRGADGSWRFAERRLAIAFRTELGPRAAPHNPPAQG